MSLNVHYMVLFKSTRDTTQFASLARQMCPKSSQFAVKAYKDAIREPYSYLLVDFRPEQDDNLRLGTNALRLYCQIYCQMSKRVKKYLPVR